MRKDRSGDLKMSQIPLTFYHPCKSFSYERKTCEEREEIGVWILTFMSK